MSRVVSVEGARWLRQVEICRRLGISDETWRRWRASGHAPEPVAGPGVPRWRVEDIDAFERGRAEQSARRTFFRSAVRRRA